MPQLQFPHTKVVAHTLHNGQNCSSKQRLSSRTVLQRPPSLTDKTFSLPNTRAHLTEIQRVEPGSGLGGKCFKVLPTRAVQPLASAPRLSAPRPPHHPPLLQLPTSASPPFRPAPLPEADLAWMRDSGLGLGFVFRVWETPSQ